MALKVDLMVEEWRRDGGTVDQSWWNSRTSHGGTVKYLMVEEWKRDVGTVQHLMVEKWNNHGGTVEQLIVNKWNI